MKGPKYNNNPRIWEFDVDDTIIMWDLSKYKKLKKITVKYRGKAIKLVPHTKNINLLIKLSKIGWFIRVHSGSGMEWARAVVKALKIEPYVNTVEAKPLGISDDQPPGDGLAYKAWRDLTSGEDLPVVINKTEPTVVRKSK
jgi:hypothetical protein